MSEDSYYSAEGEEETWPEREEDKDEKIDSIEEENEEEEKEQKGPSINFPTEVMKDIVKDIAKKYKGFSPELIKEFNTLLDEEKFLTEKRSLRSLSNDVKFTDKKVIEVVKNMIRRTSIPGPGDELYNDLYKVLVKNLSTDLRQSNTNDLDAEVTARKLAAWVLTFDEQLKILEETADDQGEQPLPQNPYYYKPDRNGSRQQGSKQRETTDGNVKLYNLSEHNTRTYWHEPGEVVELRDQDGSQIYVKDLDEGEGKKTLVKKVKNTNKGKEVSSWVVEVADSDQIKAVEENLRLGKDVVEKTPKLKLKSPATVDEWKTVADIRREEAKGWKNVVGRDSSKGESISTSGGRTSKPADPRKPDLNDPKARRPKSNEANADSMKYFIERGDMKRSLKAIQKVNLNLNPKQENYLINELKSRGEY